MVLSPAAGRTPHRRTRAGATSQPGRADRSPRRCPAGACRRFTTGCGRHGGAAGRPGRRRGPGRRVRPDGARLGESGRVRTAVLVRPNLGGVTITLWADTSVVHLSRDGHRLKTVPSRLTPATLRRLLADGGRP